MRHCIWLRACAAVWVAANGQGDGLSRLRARNEEVGRHTFVEMWNTAVANRRVNTCVLHAL